VGKSTITALLAKTMATKGKKVLAIDSDESNFGLHKMLGMSKPNDFMNYLGGKKVLFERVKTLEKEIKTEQLPVDYLSVKGNIMLLAVGKIYDFGEGCACPINALSSRLLENIILEEDEFLIADTDAGVEHLDRGIEKGCDAILVVVGPSRESIELAQRVTKMVKDLGKKPSTFSIKPMRRPKTLCGASSLITKLLHPYRETIMYSGTDYRARSSISGRKRSKKSPIFCSPKQRRKKRYRLCPHQQR
jgi:CO dehydrogenase nickel-insertion accessory protein CooC1